MTSEDKKDKSAAPTPPPKKEEKGKCKVPPNLDARQAPSCLQAADKEPEMTIPALQAFIRRHLTTTKDSNGRYVQYGVAELMSLLAHAKRIISKQPTLLEVDVPMNIVGDIHGQFIDMMQIFNSIGFPHKQNYLLLGDYIDRGPNHLEVISLLLAYKCMYPNNIFLLRGNHEWQQINYSYGFYAEVKARFPNNKEAERVFRRFNDLFSFFPLAAVVGGRILCMHGGISPGMTLDDIRNISRPLQELKGLTCDLLWADPETEPDRMSNIEVTRCDDSQKESEKEKKRNKMSNFGPNTIRGMSVVFNEAAVEECLNRLNLDLICRAHQVVLNGYEFYAKRRLVTIFSAPKYCNDFDNIAAVMRVDSQCVCSFTLFRPQLPN